MPADKNKQPVEPQPNTYRVVCTVPTLPTLTVTGGPVTRGLGQDAICHLFAPAIATPINLLRNDDCIWISADGRSSLNLVTPDGQPFRYRWALRITQPRSAPIISLVTLYVLDDSLTPFGTYTGIDGCELPPTLDVA